MTTNYIGRPSSRVDGPAKVTGEAKYAAEHNVANLAHGFVVSGRVARGRITSIDASKALELPGVLRVFTHENGPVLAANEESYRDDVAPPGSPFRPLHDNQIKYSGQPVALVVAETFELARYAASLVLVELESTGHATDLEKQRREAYEPVEREAPEPRGNARMAFAEADLQVEAEYRVPVEHHNPMEPFATTVVWEEEGRITVFDKTQGVQNIRDYLCSVFGCSRDELRVVSPFVGGAFGSGLRPQYQVFLAVLAARELKRSVRVCLTRQQMFTFGHRPATWQRISLGAAGNGTLQSVIHETISETSRFEDYAEAVVPWSGLLYKCNNVRLNHQVVQLDLHTPLDMRAPGAAWGVYALECAMDELAVTLNMDPIELRLRNYAERDQNEDKPFSSKELRACYQQGGQRFGWEKRNPKRESMKVGHTLIGWGMAGGIWEAQQLKAAAKAVLTTDGKLIVSSATADIGTGTYTIMTQIAAELLGLPLENVSFKLGDSSLPKSPVEGGSFTAATVGSAVKAVCEKVRQRLFRLAGEMDNSPFTSATLKDLTFSNGQIRLASDPARAVSVAETMRHAKIDILEDEATVESDALREEYSCYAHSAVFAEVTVDEDFGIVRVPRVVSAVAGGRILNPKSARSQVIGAIVGGIGMALEEESVIDHAFGRFMTHNLADYHVPVHADIQNIDVIFVEERDEIVNPLGVKGLGEIGIVGVAAAIANAVFHATGKRVRDLPVTPDKLL